MAVSARLATCQRALRLERVIFESNGPGFRYIGHLRAFPGNAERDTLFRFRRNEKTAIPGWGRAVSGPVVPPHFLTWRTGEALFRTAHDARCGDSVTGVSWPFGPRRRLLSQLAVRSEAQRSFSPDRSTPLHTNRGSLRPHVRVLVLLDALALLDCHYASRRCKKLSIAGLGPESGARSGGEGPEP